MSKVTAPAAGEAMPATGLTQSRRGLLTALAAAPLTRRRGDSCRG